ncbi:hypothetical protein ANK1_1773 [plant metagenome]|uniref:Uncharacterized protein n=1 Tax=plant metagenome TaxID=1297885 RepID=A0A484PBJ8_9ZZZZ
MGQRWPGGRHFTAARAMRGPRGRCARAGNGAGCLPGGTGTWRPAGAGKEGGVGAFIVAVRLPGSGPVKVVRG